MVELVESMLRQPACSRMTSFAGFASFVGAIVSSVFVLCFSGGRYAWCVKGVADLGGGSFGGVRQPRPCDVGVFRDLYRCPWELIGWTRIGHERPTWAIALSQARST